MGLEEDLLSFVPQPVQAVVLLFPSKPTFKDLKKEQLARIAEGNKVSENIFFLKQVFCFFCFCKSRKIKTRIVLIFFENPLNALKFFVKGQDAGRCMRNDCSDSRHVK